MTYDPGWTAPKRWTDFLVLPVIAGLLIFGLLLWPDVPLWRAAVIGLTVAATVYLLLRSASVPRPNWPARPAGTGRYARRNLDWLLTQISTGLSDPERFGPVLRIRLLALTTGLLDRRGIAFESEQAISLIGGRSHQLLADPAARPTRRDLIDLAAAVSRLADDPQRTKSASNERGRTKGNPVS